MDVEKIVWKYIWRGNFIVMGIRGENDVRE